MIYLLISEINSFSLFLKKWLEFFIFEKIKKSTVKNIFIQPIDDYGIDGDFVESQAFAFLALRSIFKLPISFPGTTGCKKPLTGGEIIQFK